MSIGVSGELTEGSPRFSTITPLVRYELQRFSVRREEGGQCRWHEMPTSPLAQDSTPTPQGWSWGLSGSPSPSPAPLSSWLSSRRGYGQPEGEDGSTGGQPEQVHIAAGSISTRYWSS